MARMKTFFIYFILVVAFFIFSQIMIYISLNTTLQYKNIELKTTIPMQVEVQATSINGFAKGKVINETENEIQNKYIKIECYSKNDVLMGTKYIQIDKVGAKEEKEFEVHFNFNKVDKAVIDIVDEKTLEEQNVTEEQKTSDPERGLATMATALILLCFI